jgi:type IV pilus assembly protein PilY1
MTKVMRKTTGTVLGLALALASGMPVLADDTEILLLTPPEPSELKPNVLFILDTSGSMTTVQETGAPYDPLKDYSAFGTCDADRIYYSDSAIVPVCDETNTRHIDKASFHCAASAIQVDGVGTYTDVLVQYRENASGVQEWLELEPGNSSADVECEDDSGTHGENNAVTATDVYAASGSGLAYPWTRPELPEGPGNERPDAF